MNIQRLKFAWARGARLQFCSALNSDNWGLSGAFDNGSKLIPHLKYRVHPDDAHLEYGPVSTAFRDMALFTDSIELPEIVELFMDLAGSNWVIGRDFHFDLCVEIDFARLFFAEYLADEGL